MIANYGYEDALGCYFISIDTSKCNGCGDCVRACGNAVLNLRVGDYGDTVAVVDDVHRKKLRYSCALCKRTPSVPPKRPRVLPCLLACTAGAIAHSW